MCSEVMGGHVLARDADGANLCLLRKKDKLESSPSCSFPLAGRLDDF